MRMTPWLIALLLVGNALLLAWQWEALARWGWAPDSAREPERLSMQIRPEALRAETPAASAQRQAAQPSTAEASEPPTANASAPTPDP